MCNININYLSATVTYAAYVLHWYKQAVQHNDMSRCMLQQHKIPVYQSYQSACDTLATCVPVTQSTCVMELAVCHWYNLPVY